MTAALTDAQIREIVRQELRGLSAELLERAFDVPQNPDDFNMRISESIEDAANYRQIVSDSVLGVIEKQVDESLAPHHSGRNLDATQDGGGFRIGNSHYESPSLHGRLTRYVTGAIVAASRWLQRRAWVRQVAATAPRPSDTTDRDTGGVE